jgi:sugar lactone lactonase YvrE
MTIRAFLITLLMTVPAMAHPSWGIVVDRAGRVTYSDLETIWRIGADGKPVVVRPGVSGRHVHELFADERGNIYGADFVYENGQFRTTPWRMTPSGQVTTLPVAGIVRDRQGNIYAIEENTKIVKRTPSGSVNVLASGFAHIVGMTIAPDGALYVTDAAAIKRVSAAGAVTTVAAGLDVDKDAREPVRFGGLMGIAAAARGVYAADLRNRRIVRVTPRGRVITILRSDPPYLPTGVALAPNGDVWVLEIAFRPPGTWYAPRARKIPRYSSYSSEP